MNQQLFRKKSVDKVSSPEQLNEYIRVANPGVWMVLAAIVILLAGVVVGLIVVTTVYSGVEYFIQNWNCLWD